MHAKAARRKAPVKLPIESENFGGSVSGEWLEGGNERQSTHSTRRKPLHAGSLQIALLEMIAVLPTLFLI